MPHVTAEDKVLPDIREWRRYVKVPDLVANCRDWSSALAKRDATNRDEKLVTGFMSTGIFEQSHFLMGFEDALCDLLAEPESMHELLEAIYEYKRTYARLLIDTLKPDIILSHDDWGAKRSLFMSPDTWRCYFKPLYARLYAEFHEAGVLVMHHADSFLEEIVDDLVEIGVDIWQGVLPQNDIVAIQKRVAGRLTLMGGIDAAVVDRADASEEEIRAEVRSACETYGPLGGFIPCLTYGAPGSIYPHVDPLIDDEIDRQSALF
jgi:uroporphyrinogen-III decarboxylase